MTKSNFFFYSLVDFWLKNALYIIKDSALLFLWKADNNI